VVPKIREVDDLFRKHPALREIIREAHPEACFRERVGRPMNYSKKKREGQDEDRRRCAKDFYDLGEILKLDEIFTRGRKEGLKPDDIVDAAVACWSALRLATRKGRSLIEAAIALDLPMTIWV
jgi:predicted RNase H-like nuclease